MSSEDVDRAIHAALHRKDTTDHDQVTCGNMASCHRLRPCQCERQGSQCISDRVHEHALRHSRQLSVLELLPVDPEIRPETAVHTDGGEFCEEEVCVVKVQPCPRLITRNPAPNADIAEELISKKLWNECHQETTGPGKQYGRLENFVVDFRGRGSDEKLECVQSNQNDKEGCRRVSELEKEALEITHLSV